MAQESVAILEGDVTPRVTGTSRPPRGTLLDPIPSSDLPSILRYL